jgi:hypothetical protein
MDRALRHDEALLPEKLDASVPQIDEESTFEHKEELVIAIMLVPVILALQYAQSHDGVVHFAQRLVVPAIRTRFDQRGHIDHAQRRMKYVEKRCVRVFLAIRHEASSLALLKQPVNRYRCSGGSILICAENRACAAGSTGLCLTFVLAGSFPRKLSSFQLVDGLIGRGTNPPPQFGQTLPRTSSTQVAQNVHS